MIKRYPTHCNDDTCASMVQAGNFIYLAHHAGGFDKLDASYQTKKAFESMNETLKQAGARLKDLVKINLYLRDLKDFREARDVFVEVFGDNPPARMTTTTNFYDRECLVMIDGVAYIDK